MRFTCITIDDQNEALSLLKSHIELIPELQLKLETTDPLEALKFLQTEKVDLIFLDIEMPGFSGLDFLEVIKEKKGTRSPKIIFTTGYDKYAKIGYEYGVFHYLEKPIVFRKVYSAFERFLADRQEPIPARDFIFIDYNGAKINLKFNDIAFIEAQGNYLDIYTTHLRMAAVKNTLHFFEKELPELLFLKVSRSYIVNIRKIKGVKGNKIEVEVSPSSFREIPIGKTYREAVQRTLGI